MLAKYSIWATGSEENRTRFIDELRKLGYDVPRLNTYIKTYIGIKGLNTFPLEFTSMKDWYSISINTDIEWQFNAGVAIACQQHPEQFHENEWVVLDDNHLSTSFTVGKLYQLGGEYYTKSKNQEFHVKIDDEGDQNGNSSNKFHKASSEEILAHFRTKAVDTASEAVFRGNVAAKAIPNTLIKLTSIKFPTGEIKVGDKVKIISNHCHTFFFGEEVEIISLYDDRSVMIYGATNGQFEQALERKDFKLLNIQNQSNMNFKIGDKAKINKELLYVKGSKAGDEVTISSDLITTECTKPYYKVKFENFNSNAYAADLEPISSSKEIISYSLNEEGKKFKPAIDVMLNIPLTTPDNKVVYIEQIAILKKAEVLDKWFDPVYAPEKPTQEFITIGNNNVQVRISKDGAIKFRNTFTDILKVKWLLEKAMTINKVEIAEFILQVKQDVRFILIGCQDENNLFSINDLQKVVDTHTKLNA
jgi:hypothetical protein